MLPLLRRVRGNRPGRPPSARASSFAATFAERSARYWTPERLQALSGGRDLPLSPDKPGAAALLRVIGLMGSDGSIGSEAVRKFRQINLLLLEVERHLAPHASRPTRKPLRVLELASGQSQLSLLLAHAAAHRWGRPAQVLAVDRDVTRVQRAERRAHALGLSHAVVQRRSEIGQLGRWEDEHAAAFPPRDGAAAPPGPPHLAVALHACDTASDDALAQAVRARSLLIACAPCCHAQLARRWSELPDRLVQLHPLRTIHTVPHLRSETAAHVTDAMRVALLRAAGYRVAASEFVAPEHTPKNRLLLAGRLRAGVPATRAAQEEGLAEYVALKSATGGAGIALEGLLGSVGIRT
uniref:Methyltransferase domain-containing protein n=1 Tax=Emiliania huxleyi TaxID=2903 RepID=A0A6U8IWZ2_EMIHU|mmetsp:Transcript_36070/g.116214  ORF Transcript_36070/g.116214 Transcript_36070/m.116214 type:complete len:353 (-) Transcript_36070:218-1276(-)